LLKSGAVRAEVQKAVALWVLRAWSSAAVGLVGGGNTPWKARNLEQVDDTGDGRVSEPIVNTLETDSVVSARASARVKAAPENVTSGGPGEPGPRRVSRSLKEERNRRGERLQERLNTNPGERFGSRSKASKPRRPTHGSRLAGE
jgi:hypothetical protein